MASRRRRERTRRPPAVPIPTLVPRHRASGWGGLARALGSPRFAMAAVAAAVGAGLLSSLAAGQAAGLVGALPSSLCQSKKCDGE